MQKKSKKSKIWTRPFAVVFTLDLLTQIGFYLTNPIMAGYAEWLGASIPLAGIIFGSSSLAACVSRPATSLLTNRLNARPLMIAGVGIFCGSLVLGVLAVEPMLLGVSRVLMGLGFSLKSTLVILIAALVIPRESLGEGMGILGLSNVLGMALGPAAGTALCDAMGYRAAIGVAAFALAIAVVIAMTMRYPESLCGRPKEGLRALAHFKLSDVICLGAVPFAMTSACFSCVTGTVTSFLVLASVEKGIEHASLYFTVLAVATLITRPMAGRLSDQLGARRLVVPACGFMCATLLLLANMQALWMIILAGLCNSLGYNAILPILQAECLRRARPEELGAASGTYFIGPDLGNLLGPTIAGFVIAAVGYSAAFTLTCAMVALGLCIFLTATRKPASA